MIVAIVGSRTYPHPERVTEYVAQLDVDDEVVSGDGGIVDQTAQQAALTRRLVAFWDERSRGTVAQFAERVAPLIDDAHGALANLHDYIDNVPGPDST